MTDLKLFQRFVVCFFIKLNRRQAQAGKILDFVLAIVRGPSQLRLGCFQIARLK